jgi:hypothetical protein
MGCASATGGFGDAGGRRVGSGAVGLTGVGGGLTGAAGAGRVGRSGVVGPGLTRGGVAAEVADRQPHA